MSASLTIHMQDLPAEQCATAKMHALPGEGRDALQAAWKQWVQEHGADRAWWWRLL